ncbi:Lhr family ATP-dependent helicase [Zafaria sp. Z1313]|uniref:Lhr family ATP-dependent helicase n=1 Tax=unclassified Zafaria TaxID=2828765 RepID=UPI002E7A5705|nr:DEAD/DEAH box helicase [Zafaria sp. J156]MEE1622684.1 DEAD/DEAH box helicase [Zafaria sp. J156]
MEPQAPTTSVMDRFTPATREWFTGAFNAPTAAQLGSWQAVSSGANALVIAPTGSGKTLSAFLWALDSFIRAADAPRQAELDLDGVTGTPARHARRTTRVLYISPLKALGVDVERNLRSPLIGITQIAGRLGLPAPEITVGVRSGDTPASERRKLLSHPPDILITTPESLFLMLTSRARATLAGVDTVIVDEVHAVAGTKRGAHLAVSLERLDALLARPAQRIGLSATVEPRGEVARFLGGARPVEVVAPESAKTWELTVTVPVEDMTDLPAAAAAHDLGPASGLQPQASIWPHVEEKIVDLVLSRRSTIVFANSRRLAERLTGRLNEIHSLRLAAAEGTDPWGVDGTGDVWAEGGTGAGPGQGSRGSAPGTGPGGPPGRMPAEIMAQAGTVAGAEPLLARAHHGSVSKDQRAQIEDDLKSGRLRCVVATSSLELGIDMGLVDLVIQVESPTSVASGLQRVGRAGHQVGETSHGVFFPKHRGDLVNTAVAVERMLAGGIEPLRVPANPLDILAQQTVAATALGAVDAEEWFDVVRRSAPFAALPRSAFHAVLDLLAGKYPSDEFAELRPRIIWDRDAGTITGRPGAQRLAVTSGGTIPDRGLFGVFLAGSEDTVKGGRRVGELDEEMVYESRVGDVFALGATSWRIEDITHDKVIVTPAFGQPGKLPFWSGDALGRPVELGYALGAFRRELAAAGDDEAARRLDAIGLDGWAAANVRNYLRAQREATGVVPSDSSLVVERFQDELGDWRVVLHSPFGLPVHAPWALAVGARLHERYGLDGSAMAADDGIVLRVPMMEDEPPGAELFLFEEDELESIVTAEVGGSALFASRFRECAARALLLPRQNPAKRTPLWQQRQRSAQLLDVARKYPTFPIILETVRECLQDVYDLPALRSIAAAVARREITVVETTTRAPSPFSQSLLFGYVAQFLYEGDSPLAERRAAALSLDPGLLNELLGRAELRELLDPQVIERTEAELQRLAEGYRLKGLEGTADLLRLLGPLDEAELAARLEPADGPSGPSGETAGHGPIAVHRTQIGREAAVGPEEPAAAGRHTEETAAAARHVGDLVRANRALRLNLAGRPVVAAIEDAARLRDAIGVPLPIGVPLAFVEPVADPLGDLVGRYARTHGPFTAAEAAARLGLGGAVVLAVLKRLAGEGRVVEGEFRPTAQAHDGSGEAGAEWCDAEVLRRIRRRSLAALRADVEPVDAAAYGRFLPEWQSVGARLRGLDGVATVIDQLSGVPVPASAWEGFVLPARVEDYRPGMLDELMATGEVLWSGAGALAGNDGWISLHLAENAPLTLEPDPSFEPGALHRRILAALDPGGTGLGGAYFFGQLASLVEAQGRDDVAARLPGDARGRDDAAARLPGDAQPGRPGAEGRPPVDGATAAGPSAGAPVPQEELLAALWDLVWAGRVGNDTFAPVRGMLGGGKTAHRQRAQTPRARTRLPGRYAGLGRPQRGAASGASGSRGPNPGPGVGSDLEGGAGAPGGTPLRGGLRPDASGRLEASHDAGRLPSHAAGRWSLLPAPEADPTVRAHALAEYLLDRYGVVTRGSVAVEDVPGGFGLVYKVLARLEEAGRARRGYFIERLGAAQFSTPATVDRLRGHVRDSELDAVHRADAGTPALALAATDPANPYGAALPWPAADGPSGSPGATGHRPGRKAGAVVVLVDGALALYVERGGKTLLCYEQDPARLDAVARALVAALRRAGVDKMAVEKVNGQPVPDTPLAAALLAAGFYSSPHGVRFRP